MPSVVLPPHPLAVPADEIEDPQKHIPDERAHARHLGQGAQIPCLPARADLSVLDRWLPRLLRSPP